MPSDFRNLDWTFAVGDKTSFAIEAILPALDSSQTTTGPSSVLRITDGWFTFFVKGCNVFELAPNPSVPKIVQEHCRLSLSMFLEWVLFDKAYALKTGAACFSDVVAGNSSPPIVFERMDNDVEIKWNFKGWERDGATYVNAIGKNRIPHRDYLVMLAVAADSLISVIEWRAFYSGCLKDWQEWLAGYGPEREMFRSYVETEF